MWSLILSRSFLWRDLGSLSGTVVKLKSKDPNFKTFLCKDNKIRLTKHPKQCCRGPLISYTHVFCLFVKDTIFLWVLFKLTNIKSVQNSLYETTKPSTLVRGTSQVFDYHQSINKIFMYDSYIKDVSIYISWLLRFYWFCNTQLYCLTFPFLRLITQDISLR